MPSGVLTRRSEEPGPIPGKKSSRPSRRKFGAGAGTHTLPAARGSLTLLAAEPTRRRRERRAQGTRTPVGGEASSPGCGADAGAASPGIRRVGRRGGALSPAPRRGRWEEPGAPVGRVPNAGLRRLGPEVQPLGPQVQPLGPEVQPRPGEGRELGWDTRYAGEPSGDGNWTVGAQDSGSSSRQPRADLRGGSFPGITLFTRCTPLVKSLTVSARLFPPQFKKKKKGRPSACCEPHEQL